MTTTSTEYLRETVVSYLVPLWVDKVEKANRKANRNGLGDLFTLRVEREFVDVRRDEVTGYERRTPKAEIVIDGAPAGLPGWTFVASVAWDPNAGAVVNTVPTYDGPMLGAPDAPRCDHCQTVRRRNDTYLVRDPEGHVRQVGSDCLTAYTGIPLGWVLAADSLGEGGEDDWAVHGPGYAPEYEVRSLLAATVAIVDAVGYVSAAAAEQSHHWSTRTAFSTLWHGLPNTATRQEREQYATLVERIGQTRRDAEAVEAEVDGLLAWIAAETPRSDYIANLQQILTAETGRVSQRSLGYAVSAVQAYRRHLGRIEERKAQAAVRVDAAHIGQPKQRLVLTVEVEKVVTLPDYGYGPSDLFILREVGTGSKAIWKTGSYSETVERLHEVRQDDGKSGSVTVKATVKEHGESKYNGEPETTLTRVVLA